MKTDKNFRLWKPYKRLLASCDTEQRTFLKKIFIDEQISYERFKKTSHKEKIAPSVVADA
jgi:hypothetical protein